MNAYERVDKEPGLPLLPAAPEHSGNLHTHLQSIRCSSEAERSTHHLLATGCGQRQLPRGVNYVLRLRVVKHPRLLNNLSMADPWLAHEVLRELDEAGAAYFALAMREPASSNNLVRTLAELSPFPVIMEVLYVPCWMAADSQP